MIETSKGNQNKSVDIESNKDWLWEKCAEVIHASYEYVKRHNNALKALMTTWAMENGLLEEGQYRYKLLCEQETVIKK